MYDVSDTTVNTATLVRTITANDSSSSLYFGYGLALCGNSALVGAYGDSTQASSAGAAYLMSPMITPNSGMTRIVSKGQFAPGAPDTTFNVLGEAYTNGFGAVAFTSSLTGLGSNANTDTGVWSTIKNPPGTLQLIAKARKPLAASGNQIYQSFGIPLFNEQNDLIVPCVMKLGTGTPAVTATTTKWFLNQSSGSSTPTVLLTNGSTPSVTAFNSSKIANFLETVQGNPSGQNYWANAVSLTVNAAYSTTAANDSGVIYANGTSNNFGYREGVDTIPGGGFFYGQFTGRVALPYATVLFSAATTGPVTNNQIVVVTPATSSTPVLAWQKGEAAPELGATPPTFSSIIGETLDGAPASTYVRATLTGGNPATTVLDNEGIWRRTSGGSKFLSLRKGQSIGSTGLSILKIITVSGGTYLNNGLLALVQLKGSTVNTTNDQAFIAVQEDSTAGAPNITILLREGDPVGGNGTGTIGVISRVAMESYSCFYMILATLAGAPVGTDQALYVGSTYGGNNSAQTPLRRPYLLMRKGWMYDGQPSKVKSMNFPITMQTASGFTATGRSNCMGWFKNYAITVEFENGMKQIMQGFVQ